MRRSAFTLIELIFVIVILGILAATALPRFVGVQDDAKIAAENGVIGGIRGGISVQQGQCLVRSWNNSVSSDINWSANCFPGFLELTSIIGSDGTTTGTVNVAGGTSAPFGAVLQEAPADFNYVATTGVTSRADMNSTFEGPASGTGGPTSGDINSSAYWLYEGSRGLVTIY